MNNNKNNIKILDCTLRDGGYINNWNFGRECILEIYENLDKANADFIECGFLKDGFYSDDTALFGDFKKLNRIFKNKNKEKLVIMLKVGQFDPQKFPKNKDERIFNTIRVNYCKSHTKEALEIIKKLKNYGCRVFVNPANIDIYSDYEVSELTKKLNDIEPFAFSIVDTKGSLVKKDILRLYDIINNNMKKSTRLCFHSHNNLGLSFANTLELIKICKEYELIIDSSVFGMGRGSGNLHTELIMHYLNQNDEKYNLAFIFEIIEKYINKIYLKTPWKNTTEYYLSAIYHCHQDYAKYLLNNFKLDNKEIVEIYEKIPQEKKSKYTQDIIEKLCMSKI